jgi:hypothetical protein
MERQRARSETAFAADSVSGRRELIQMVLIEPLQLAFYSIGYRKKSKIKMLW